MNVYESTIEHDPVAVPSMGVVPALHLRLAAQPAAALVTVDYVVARHRNKAVPTNPDDQAFESNVGLALQRRWDNGVRLELGGRAELNREPVTRGNDRRLPLADLRLPHRSGRVMAGSPLPQPTRRGRPRRGRPARPARPVWLGRQRGLAPAAPRPGGGAADIGRCRQALHGCVRRGRPGLSLSGCPPVRTPRLERTRVPRFSHSVCGHRPACRPSNSPSPTPRGAVRVASSASVPRWGGM